MNERTFENSSDLKMYCQSAIHTLSYQLSWWREFSLCINVFVEHACVCVCHNINKRVLLLCRRHVMKCAADVWCLIFHCVARLPQQYYYQLSSVFTPFFLLQSSASTICFLFHIVFGYCCLLVC